MDFAVGLLEPDQLNHLRPFLLHKTVDFAVVGGMASSRCRRQATAAKTTAQEKESCCLLLRWGLRFRSPLAMGRRAPWGGEPSPLPPTGDSRKNNSTRKRKLLAPAAVGLRSARQCALRGAGGGFAPLAAGHAGEESRRRPNSRTPAAVLLPSPSLMEPDQPNSPNSCRRFRPLPRPPSASVRFRRLPRPEAVYHSAVL